MKCASPTQSSPDAEHDLTEPIGGGAAVIILAGYLALWTLCFCVAPRVRAWFSSGREA